MRLVVTREDYFAAALRMLASRGHATLRIGALCDELGVTTGSFYHYFGGWDGFVEALLANWEQEKTQRLFALAGAQHDPIARLRELKTLALTLPHDAETAIRAWSHVNATVERVQRRVDDERLAALTTVLGGVVADARAVDSLAVMGMALLVGVQQWRTPVDVAELGRLLDEFEALVLTHAVVLTG